MADKDWPRGLGEASNLSNLRITTRYLDSDYEILNEDLTRSETRLLKVFSLKPKTQGKPSFHARVDDGSPKKLKEPELDIDIRGVSSAVVRDFKAKRNGYAGHHNKRKSNPDERVFDVKIVIPAGKVFKGEVFFNVAFSVGLKASATSSVSFNATVQRASCWVRLRNYLIQLRQRLSR
jgi:hypothetical protein